MPERVLQDLVSDVKLDRDGLTSVIELGDIHD